jgi:hypothetical protein
MIVSVALFFKYLLQTLIKILCCSKNKKILSSHSCVKARSVFLKIIETLFVLNHSSFSINNQKLSTMSLNSLLDIERLLNFLLLNIFVAKS